MKRKTKAPVRKLQALGQLDRQLTREWDLGADPEAAVATARRISDLLLVGAAEVDLDADYRIVGHAAEVLWDSKAFDDATTIVSRWRKAVTVLCDRRRIDRAQPQVWASILSARLEHRKGDSYTATSYAQMAIAQIARLAGGTTPLRVLLEIGKVDPLSEMYCAGLAIAIPAGRLQFVNNPTLRAQFLDRWVADAMIILGRDTPPRFNRSHALVIQTYYAIAERPWTAEREELLDRLTRFDDFLRPSHLRGQATKRLRDVARARFDGDLGRELEAAEAAHAELTFLPRHVEALSANAWWPLAVAR